MAEPNPENVPIPLKRTLDARTKRPLGHCSARPP